MLILISLLALGAIAFAWLAFRDPASLWDLQQAGYRREGIEASPGPGWEFRQKLSAVLFLVIAALWIGRYATMDRAADQGLERINQALDQFPRSTPTINPNARGDPRYGR